MINTKKLTAYSSMALAFFATYKISNAQIIYHDVNPDQTFGIPDSLDFTVIDLNNDGIFELTLQAANYTSYSTNAVEGTIPTSGSAQLAGTSGLIVNSNSLGLPYALNSGNQIGNNLQWILPNNSYYMFLAVDYVGTFTVHSGHWLNGQTDKYLGIRFKDASAQLHYGWIRLDVAPDNYHFTLKDYAYDSSPDQPINAGDGLPTNVPEFSNSIMSIFPNPSNGKAIICLPSDFDFPTTLTITNLLGQVVEQRTIESALNRVEIHQPGGTYIVSLQNHAEKLQLRWIVKE